MLAKVSLPIGSMNGGELHDALAEAGAKLLVATLPRLAAGDITPEPQDDSQASYAGMIRKQDGHIDFTKTPEEIERLIRGFSPWPGAFCEESGKVIKFWAAEPLDEKTDAAPGTVLEADDAGLRLSCGGRVLLVTELQVPGKKRTRVQRLFERKQNGKGDRSGLRIDPAGSMINRYGGISHVGLLRKLLDTDSCDFVHILRAGKGQFQF